MSSFRPVIILGAARSGTNMLRDILSQIPDYGTWDCDEINPIWRHGNIDVSHDEFTADMASPKIKKFIRREFKKIAASQNVYNVIEKSCASTLRIPFINEVFPDATYIVIERDGRDTTASAMIRWKSKFELGYTLKKVKYIPKIDFPYYVFNYGLARIRQVFSKEKKMSFWGLRLKNMPQLLQQYTLEEICALQWRRAVEKCQEDLQTIPASRKYFLRYEDFVQHPEQGLQDVLKFLDVEDTINVAGLVENVSAKNIGKYAKQLTSKQISQIEKITNKVDMQAS